MKRLACLLFLVYGTISFARNSSIDWPDHYYRGYAKTVAGERFLYHSPYPSVTMSLIIRANKTYHPGEWETEKIPGDFKAREAVFIWMYGMDANPETRTFELSINGKPALSFKNPAVSSLNPEVIKVTNGAELEFRPVMLDIYKDPMGYAILRIPASMIIPGEPQRLKISGEDASSQIWCMTFEYSVEENLDISQDQVVIRNKKGLMMGIRYEFMHLGPAEKVSVQLNKDVCGETIIQPGYNTLMLQYPEIKKETTVTSKVRIGKKPEIIRSYTLKPVKTWNIYFVQHTHTDIGYTRPQTEILPEHLRYIDFALDYCDQTDSFPDDARFRWTCETSWAVREYLKMRPPAQVERLKKRIREGRIEVTGLFLNLSDLADEASLASTLQPVREFKKQGIPVQTAMQDDVNGAGWCLTDYLPGIGVRYLSMGENADRALRPFDKPTAFWWESPSGSRILAYRGEHYMWGNFMGIISGDLQAFGQSLLREIRKLEVSGYPFDRIAVQFGGYFTDNSPPSTLACQLVKEWNDKYEYPHLRLATVHEFPQFLEQQHANDLAVYKVAWPDWWTDGFGSAAIETAYARLNHSDILANKTLLSMAMLKGAHLPSPVMTQINAVNDAITFYDEHTFGAAESISDPLTENSIVQWGEKGSYVWEALKISRLIREEALGMIQPFIPATGNPSVAIINTLGFKRDGIAEVFIDHQILSPEKPFRIMDGSGAMVPVQLIRSRPEGSYWALYVKNLPPFGYKVLEIQSGTGVLANTERKTFEGTIENDYYKLIIDIDKGAISKIFDKQLGMYLNNDQAPWKFGQFIYEKLANREQISAFKLEDYTREPLKDITKRDWIDGPIWTSITMNGRSDQCAEAPGISFEIRLYKQEKRIELRYSMKKLPVTHPEGVYISFPFSLPGGHLAFESQGGMVVPGKDQLEGTSSDWNGIQNFAVVRNDKSQIVITSPEIPLMMFGDLNLGKFQRVSNPQTNYIYSWVLNNYWHTNFRASQEGELKWSYAITSGNNPSNQFATEFGWGWRIPLLYRVIPAGNGKLAEREFSLLKTGLGSVILISARPAANGKDIILQLRESAGQASEINLKEWLSLATIKEIREVNAIEENTGDILQAISFSPWQSRFLMLKLAE